MYQLALSGAVVQIMDTRSLLLTIILCDHVANLFVFLSKCSIKLTIFTSRLILNDEMNFRGQSLSNDTWPQRLIYPWVNCERIKPTYIPPYDPQTQQCVRLPGSRRKTRGIFGKWPSVWTVQQRKIFAADERSAHTVHSIVGRLDMIAEYLW